MGVFLISVILHTLKYIFGSYLQFWLGRFWKNYTQFNSIRFQYYQFIAVLPLLNLTIIPLYLTLLGQQKIDSNLFKLTNRYFWRCKSQQKIWTFYSLFCCNEMKRRRKNQLQPNFLQLLNKTTIHLQMYVRQKKHKLYRQSQFSPDEDDFGKMARGLQSKQLLKKRWRWFWQSGTWPSIKARL